MEVKPGPLSPSHPSSQEPSPYDESDVHDSFHRIIQEQTQWAAAQALELQPREPGAGTQAASGEPAWPRPRCWGGAGWVLSLLNFPGHPSMQSAGLGWGRG